MENNLSKNFSKDILDKCKDVTIKCAEKTILAILIYNDKITNEQVETIFSYIPDEMFLNGVNRKIYNIFKQVYKDNKQIYKSSQFFKMLWQVCSFEDDSLLREIPELEEYWSPTVTISFWIEKIQQEYFSYRYALAKSKEDYQKVSDLESKISYIQNNSETLSSSYDLDEYEKRKKSAVFTSYREINRYVGSLQGGDMIILAGSPGSGKTCFMLNVALGMATMGKNIDIYSLEMPPYQLRQRIICSLAEIDAIKFRNFTLTDEEKRRYKNYVDNDFKSLNINIYNKQVVTMEDIKRRTLKSKSDLVIIDYLGLISGDTNKNSYERYSNISRDIKLLAMEANKPILCLHQLSREYDKRDDKKPRMSDLRDSGKIEQDADMIWLIYRPILFDEKAKEDEMYFILAKNRHGETNKEIKLKFNGAKQRILDMKGYIDEVYNSRQATN